MGALLACCAVDACCCATKCLCCALPCKPSISTRVWYTVTFLATTIVAWVLKNWGHLIPGTVTEKCDSACWSYLAVYRTSLGFILYHVTLLLLTIGVQSSQDVRASIHNGWWPLKICVWAASIIGCFFIDSSAFANYWIAAFVFSAVFIVVQCVLLVDFSWAWTENWVDKMDDDTRGSLYRVSLIFCTVLFFAGVIVVTALLYYYWTEKNGCSMNTAFVTVNLLLAIIMSVCSVLPAVQEANPKSGIFQSAIMSLYISHLVASAIVAQPNDSSFSCGPVPGNYGGSINFVAVIEIIITFLALGYQAISAGSSSGAMFGSEDDETDETTYNYSWFHFVFIMAAMYMAAVLNNWTTSVQTAGDPLSLGKGFTAMWIKVSTSWICAVIYLWTLFAPLVFPDRFGD